MYVTFSCYSYSKWFVDGPLATNKTSLVADCKKTINKIYNYCQLSLKTNELSFLLTVSRLSPENQKMSPISFLVVESLLDISVFVSLELKKGFYVCDM